MKAALPFVAIMLAWLGIIVVYPPLVLYLVGQGHGDAFPQSVAGGQIWVVDGEQGELPS